MKVKLEGENPEYLGWEKKRKFAWLEIFDRKAKRTKRGAKCDFFRYFP